MMEQVQVAFSDRRAVERQTDSVRWNLVHRIAFRFVFSYLVLYCLYLLEILWIFLVLTTRRTIPDGFVAPLWHIVVPWFGHCVLHLRSALDFNQNGSGDSSYEYTLVLCELLLAAIATCLWSFLDRQRLNYRSLHAWIRLPVRLLLAGMMFSYGSEKIFLLQFGHLSLADLSRSFGEMSPPTLMWNFMAASSVYTIFAGCVEVLGGILLLFPQTVTLGALVVLTAMTNVVIMDLSYDVGVKLLSGHFALLALFLLADHVPPLAGLLFLNRPAQPVRYPSLARRRAFDVTAQLLVPVLGSLLLVFFMYSAHRAYRRQLAKRADRSPLFGIWDVDSFVTNGPSRGRMFTAKISDALQLPPGGDQWQRLVFEDSRSAVIQLKDQHGAQVLDTVQLKLDPASGSIHFTDDADSSWKCDLDFQRPEPSLLLLRGTVNGSPVSIALHREDDSRFLLRDREVHWILERNNFN